MGENYLYQKCRETITDGPERTLGKNNKRCIRTLWEKITLIRRTQEPEREKK